MMFVACSGFEPASIDPTDDHPLTLEEVMDLPVWPGALHLGAADSSGWIFIATTNDGSDTLAGALGPRNWWFEVFADSGRSGSPIWIGSSTTPEDIGQTMVIAPGGSATTFPARLPPDSVMRAGHATGRYFFSAALVMSPPGDLSKFFRTAFLPLGARDLR
jgi:hypothetical protein